MAQHYNYNTKFYVYHETRVNIRVPPTWQKTVHISCFQRINFKKIQFYITPQLRGIVPHATGGIVPHATRGIVHHATRGIVPRATRGIVRHATRGIVCHAIRGIAHHFTSGIVRCFTMDDRNTIELPSQTTFQK